MQIDFHHTVTYVCARFAGFSAEEAEVVAYCAQYVDDATNSGNIRFDNDAMYKRISSSHKTFDYSNFDELANHQVWIPFHFLPGNGGKPAGENPTGSFINKLVCRPNSYVAQDMVRACIEDRDKPYGLHRLGVTMHVFADTWAHQGFAGVTHKINNLRALDDQDKPERGLFGRLKRKFGDLVDDVASGFVGGVKPLGHGAALDYPDRPYLVWRYKGSDRKKVVRDNPRDFTEAADEMCKAMQRYRAGDPNEQAAGLPGEARQKIMDMFHAQSSDDGHKRHKGWLKALADNHFGIGAERPVYVAKGKESWKHQALGTVESVDKGDERFPYSPGFLKSDWKMFHDALQAHRFEVLHDILPKYGICAA